MNVDKEHWKDSDLNVDSLWLIGPRAKGGKHNNLYHGNFVPQIPNQMIRRFTNEGDLVLDMFVGSGTTLFECETLKRNFIGFDINQSVIEQVESKMMDSTDIRYVIHNVDITNEQMAKMSIDEDLKSFKKQKVDLIISHPPYMDIIPFTEREEDLSKISDLKTFIDTYIKAVQNVWGYLKANKHFVLVIGDVYKESEVKPLGMLLMYAIKKNFNCKLKGILVKDMVGNRAKLGQEALWKYRALRNGTFLFKHEYVFVFRKEGV
ncbi:MAG: hypothetical protein MJZ33_11735 [Paludibacteraceae bacterium]|nr:hypothetical protein [Paludibacteraceae bacterium]